MENEKKKVKERNGIKEPARREANEKKDESFVRDDGGAGSGLLAGYYWEALGELLFRK